MFSLTTIVLSLSLLASQTLAAPNSQRPSRHARWIQTPPTLLDPQFLKRDHLEARAPADVGFSPLERKDIFLRQTSTCNPGEVECLGDKCCPASYNCYYPAGSVAACCPAGETCTGPPVGCADPNSLECPTNIGGCCPIGQACYLDATNVARCDNTGLYSNSISVPSLTPVITTPIFTTPTTPVFTPTTPVFTPVVPTTTPSTQKTPDGSIAVGPATVTVKSGAEKMAMEAGALAIMMGTLVALA